MMFTDGSDATVAGLQQVFAIDRAMAEKLLREVPVVVKRAADPSVAAALIDALQKLGAQVVLLPSSGATAAERREHVVLPEPEAPAPQWGGLDLEPRPMPRVPSELELELGTGRAPATDSADRKVSPDALAGAERKLHAPRASVIPLLDLRADGDTMMASRAEDFVSGGEADLSDSQEFPSIPPLFDQPLSAALQTNGVANSDREPLAVRSSRPPGEPSALRRSPMPTHMDLGLGTVPPLPSLKSARPVAKRAPLAPPPTPRAGQHVAVAPPPPPAVRARKPGPTPERPRDPLRAAEVSDRVELPEIDAAARTPPRNPAQAAPRLASGDAYWTARRSDPPEAPEREPAGARSAQRADELDQSPTVEASARTPPAHTAPSARPAAGHPRGLALVELLAGLLVLYLGVHFDNSVLYGNATLASLVLHGLALYGIGGGIAGLWP